MHTIYALRPGAPPALVASFPPFRRAEAETELERLSGTRTVRERLAGVRYILVVRRAACPLVANLSAI
jgi:hypothetical protein